MSEAAAFSAETLAQHWGVSSATIRNLVRAKQLRAFRVGRQIRIRPEAVEEYEARQCQDGESENTAAPLLQSGARTEKPSGSRLGPVIGARRSAA